MQVEEKLSKFILENRLFTKKDRILLGVSGGKDSMLMTVLLHRLGYQLIIAHCNFHLRGKESDKDEILVQEIATKLGIPFFAKHFDTHAHAEAHKVSIQMSARELRYQWFEELCQAQQCHVIAIAQHRQDNIETVFINLLRGTGLQGLQGILPKRGRIVRPLLYMDTEEIEQAVRAYQVAYRDDQSNFSTKYVRNKIRLDILPVLREIKPDFDQIMEDNIHRFRDTYQLLQDFITSLHDQLFIPQGDYTVIKKESLVPHRNNLPLLYELFRPYGFTNKVLDDLSRSWENRSGLRFTSDQFELLVDRELIYLQKRDTQAQADIFIKEHTKAISIGSKTLHLSTSENKEILQDPHTAQVDKDKLVYPLQIRYWQTGDRFIPLGMSGEQKLSDFFIQQKIPLFEKNRIPLLVNGNGEIVWIIGYRLDNRYKIREITKKVITFVYG